MLKKLFKYEWKSASMLLLILHGVLLIYSLVGRLGYQLYFDNMGVSPTRGQEFMLGMYVLVYVLGILAVSLVTYIYLASRMQKNLFSDEGYLTHTLPVTPNSLIWSKVFIFWLWMAIDFLCIMLSLGILLLNRHSIPLFWDTMTEIWKQLVAPEVIGDSILAVVTIIVEFLGLYTGILIFSICLGSLFNVHKLLGAIVSFFGLNIVLNIVNTFLIYFVGINDNSQPSPLITSGRITLIVSLIFSLICSAVFYFGSKFIMSKKLNLS